MLIDLIFALFLVLALWRGFRQGLIVGLFSFVAIIIGLAAALKLSAVIAIKLSGHSIISEQWLPFISFILVFIVVVLLVRLGAIVIKRTITLVMLGWVDKLGGMIFFTAIYIILFSVLLFFATKMEWIDHQIAAHSVVYDFVQPWGPKTINALGSLIPWFSNTFSKLEEFFGSMATHIR